MKLVAVMDKIFVRELIEKEKTTEAGIILTEDVAQKQEPQKCGVVVSVGENVRYKLNEGDIIVFHRMAGQAMIINNEIFRILKDDEVYGILRDENIDDEYPDPDCDQAKPDCSEI